jgi:hypothetical protein
MNKFNVGDLVYIPSEVVIFNDTQTFKLPAPVSLLITGKKNRYYEVFFESKSWLVDQSSVYKTE